MRGLYLSSSSRRRLFLGLLLLHGVVGCGGSVAKDALKMRLAELEDRINLLRSHGDALEGRIVALENRPSHAPAKAAEAPRGSSTDAPPRLEVVKLVPPGESQPSRPDDGLDGSASDSTGSDESRPVIQGSGDRLETRVVGTTARPTGNDTRVTPKRGKALAPSGPEGSNGGRSSTAGGKLSTEARPPVPPTATP